MRISIIRCLYYELKELVLDLFPCSVQVDDWHSVPRRWLKREYGRTNVDNEPHDFRYGIICEAEKQGVLEPIAKEDKNA